MTHEEVEHWSMGRPDREDQSSVAFKTFIFFLFILMAFSSIESNPISQFSFPISLIPLLTLFFHFPRQWRWSFSQPSPTLNSLLQWTKTPPSKKPPPASTPSKSSSHYSLTLTLLISTPIAKPSLTPPSPTSERPFLSSAAPLEPATPDSAVPLWIPLKFTTLRPFNKFLRPSTASIPPPPSISLTPLLLVPPS